MRHSPPWSGGALPVRLHGYPLIDAGAEYPLGRPGFLRFVKRALAGERGPQCRCKLPTAAQLDAFLESEDARPLRILAAHLEPMQAFRRARACDTIVFFGSARRRHRRSPAPANAGADANCEVSLHDAC